MSHENVIPSSGKSTTDTGIDPVPVTSEGLPPEFTEMLTWGLEESEQPAAGATAIDPQAFLLEQDRQLLKNGYEPIVDHWKKPNRSAWSAAPITRETLAEDRQRKTFVATKYQGQKYDYYGLPEGTALRTGGGGGKVLAIDIDPTPLQDLNDKLTVVDDPTETLGEVITERLPGALGPRTGSKGCAYLVRCDVPVETMTIVAEHPTLETKRWLGTNSFELIPARVVIELLGNGRKISVYGPHVCRRSYRWQGDDPLKIPHAKLPVVTLEDIDRLADALKDKLQELGYAIVEDEKKKTRDKKRGGIRAAGERQGSPVPRDYLERMLALFDPAVSNEEWWPRIAQIRATPLANIAPEQMDDALLEICDQWSEGKFWSAGSEPYNYDWNAVRDCFWGHPPKDGGYTFGSLYHDAVELGWTEPAPGATGSSKASELFGRDMLQHTGDFDPETIPSCAEEPTPALRSRFAGMWPHEFADLPDIEFWDQEETLLKSPEGAVAVLCGDFGSHKTNTTLTKMLDAAIEKGARVLYAAGEGELGVGKHRLPAHCAARGIDVRELMQTKSGGAFKVVRAVPLFASAAEVAAFIDASRDYNPDIVVLDTLATALAGTDENSAQASAFLTDNGPAGQIKRAFKALVFLPSHVGKDASKGIRGHSGFGGNADTVLMQEADDCGAIKQHVRKMRDGRDGFDVYFKAPPKGSEGVPVPVRIDAAEYMQMVGQKTPISAEADTFYLRRKLLDDRGIHSFEGGWTHRQFAEALAERAVIDTAGLRSLEAASRRETWIAKQAKSLMNATRSKTYENVLAHLAVPVGGGGLQWRWYSPQPDA